MAPADFESSLSYATPGPPTQRRLMGLLSLILAAIQFPVALFAPVFAWLFIWGDNNPPPGGWIFYMLIVLEPAWFALGMGATAYIRRRSPADRLMGEIGFFGALAAVIWAVCNVRPV